ncbi:MAG: DUF4430 domain-containing protein [Solirubrobacteraceae bacterium]
MRRGARTIRTLGILRPAARKASGRTGKGGAGVVLLAILGAAGCGLGPGPGTGDVTVTVTHAFGSAKVATITQSKVPGSETVMRLLTRSFSVQTRYGGGFVESIDGAAGTSSHLDWFYYVNGIQGSAGAAATTVHRGDRIWWDRHDWSATNSIPAVVGSFPEPFVHGIGGKRFPTTVECAHDLEAACARVSAELGSAGVPAASQLLGTGSGTDTLGVVVGTWGELHSGIAAHLIEHGPSASGIYARFSGPRGEALELLGPDGQTVRTLHAGAGLIAATADSTSEPTWLVTGTDAAGVLAAARALTPARLHDAFALAVQGNTDLPLPLQGATPPSGAKAPPRAT